MKPKDLLAGRETSRDETHRPPEGLAKIGIRLEFIFFNIVTAFKFDPQCRYNFFTVDIFWRIQFIQQSGSYRVPILEVNPKSIKDFDGEVREHNFHFNENGCFARCRDSGVQRSHARQSVKIVLSDQGQAKDPTPRI